MELEIQSIDHQPLLKGDRMNTYNLNFEGMQELHENISKSFSFFCRLGMKSRIWEKKTPKFVTQEKRT